MTFTLLKDDVAEIVRLHRPHTFPGFEETHRRIERNRRRTHRQNPCALAVLPEDAAKPRARKRRPQMYDGKMRGRANHGHEELSWQAVESAWERRELRPGRDYPLAEVRRICNRAFCDMDLICLDLAEHRASVIVTHVSLNVWRFTARFGEGRI